MEFPTVYSPENEANFNDQEYAGIDDDGVGFEDGEYTGLNDDHVDFGGDGGSFANELASMRTFTVVINNTNANSERLSFGAAMLPIAGTTQLTEGAAKAGVAVSGSPNSYDFFKKFIEKNPTRLVALKIQSNNEAQLAQSLIVSHVSPFENLGSKPIALSSFTKESNYNAKMVTLKNLNMQLDNQTDIAIDIPANTQTIFTLYCGGIYNPAAVLNRKGNRAKKSRKVQAAKA